MTWKENKRVYNRQYNKSAYKQIVLLIRKDDTQMLNHLSKQDSVNAYIRDLIKKDMKSE